MHVLPTAAVKPEDALLKTLQWLSHVPKLFMELLWLAGAALPGGQSAQLSIPKEQLLRAVVDMEAKHWPNLKRWGGKASRLHITLDALQVRRSATRHRTSHVGVCARRSPLGSRPCSCRSLCTPTGPK